MNYRKTDVRLRRSVVYGAALCAFTGLLWVACVCAHVSMESYGSMQGCELANAYEIEMQLGYFGGILAFPDLYHGFSLGFPVVFLAGMLYFYYGQDIVGRNSRAFRLGTRGLLLGILVLAYTVYAVLGGIETRMWPTPVGVTGALMKIPFGIRLFLWPLCYVLRYFGGMETVGMYSLGLGFLLMYGLDRVMYRQSGQSTEAEEPPVKAQHDTWLSAMMGAFPLVLMWSAINCIIASNMWANVFAGRELSKNNPGALTVLMWLRDYSDRYFNFLSRTDGQPVVVRLLLIVALTIALGVFLKTVIMRHDRISRVTQFLAIGFVLSYGVLGGPVVKTLAWAAPRPDVYSQRPITSYAPFLGPVMDGTAGGWYLIAYSLAWGFLLASAFWWGVLSMVKRFRRPSTAVE